MARNRRFQDSPTNDPITYKFWSDSNESNFMRDLSENQVRFERPERGVILVYDNGPTVKRMAMDYGADTY
jgi:hypothetical protein